VRAIHVARPEPKEHPFTFGGGSHSATIENDYFASEGPDPRHSEWK
jgi:hypothetical protein